MSSINSNYLQESYNSPPTKLDSNKSYKGSSSFESYLVLGAGTGNVKKGLRTNYNRQFQLSLAISKPIGEPIEIDGQTFKSGDVTPQFLARFFSAEASAAIQQTMTIIRGIYDVDRSGAQAIGGM